MARTAGKKQAPAKIEEDDDTEGWEDAVVETEGKDEPDLRLRDWRDVERYREMKELRRLVDDDYGLEEIFHIPLKPRAEPGIPAPRTAGSPAKGAKPAPAKGAGNGKGRTAHAAAPPKKAAPSKLRAKAKRR